jgi:hypothetical protein
VDGRKRGFGHRTTYIPARQPRPGRLLREPTDPCPADVLHSQRAVIPGQAVLIPVPRGFRYLINELGWSSLIPPIPELMQGQCCSQDSLPIRDTPSGKVT